MTTIKELLGQGDIRKPRRNFLQENVKKLKEMKLDKGSKMSSQRNKNLQPLSERGNAQMGARGSQRQSASMAQRHSPARTRRSVLGGGVRASVLDKQETPIATMVNDAPKGFRSQGCQTLNGKQLETLYHEGVIRYPSARPQESPDREVAHCVSVREMGLQTDSEVEIIHPPPEATSLLWDEEKYDDNTGGPKDFVKMNATIPEAHRQRTGQSFSNRSDPTKAPASYQKGVVPKYLREHKKELQRERLVKAQEAADECPEGHILLPDNIRHSHLSTLKQKYSELVSQLNQLPVSTDTLRTRTRKKQIEADLDKIEAAIALFSREKVFVRADS